VRGLIIVVLILGGWFGWTVRAARTQRQIVEGILKAGGDVKYEWEWKDGREIPGGKPCWPTWLVQHVGPDYFGHVSYLYLSFMGTDKLLAGAENLTGLEVLVCQQAPLTDEGLVHLAWLTTLRELSLAGTTVSDAGLLHLGRLVRLEFLDLSDTRVTDTGLTQLTRLASLKKLDLSNTQVTDGGLVNLQRLTGLKSLSVDDAKVTDIGVRNLKDALPLLRISR
jgi:hypothetical protein